jgi:glycosyltransferase involved in cell wall biosynthesis
MKLLVYSHNFLPSIGGVEKIVLSLAKGLAEWRYNGLREFEVTLATQTPARDFDDQTLPFPIVRQPGIKALWRLVGFADIVHLAGPALAPLFLARLAGKPVVIEHHGYQAICPNGLLLHQPDGSVCPGHFQSGHYAECLRCQCIEMRLWQSLKRLLAMFPRHFLSRRAAQNIAISRHVLERHALPASSVVYYGIEAESAPDSSLRGLPSASAKVRFAYVGRLVAEKGLTVLLNAAAILRNEGYEFEILLIGDGPERPRLERILDEAGLRDVVHCTGFLQGAVFEQMLRSVDVVAMPSVWEETAGLAAIEHMMRGRPVIASRIGGLGEIVGDSALTCEPRNPLDLARCMRGIVRDHDKLTTIGAVAHKRATELFLRSRMIAEHAEIYRHVVQERSSKHTRGSVKNRNRQ